MLTHFFPDLIGKTRGLSITNSNLAGRSPAGIPIGSLSSLRASSTSQFRSRLNTSPAEVIMCPDHQAALYLHLLFGLLEQNLAFINSVFSSSVLALFQCLENNWPQLLEDLEHSRINPAIRIDPGLRSKLEHRLQSARNHSRVMALRRELETGFENIAPRLWPRLVSVICIGSGSFRVYTDKLNRYLGQVPLYSPAYIASEGIIGLNLQPGELNYTLLPGLGYYEFIRVKDLDMASPRCYDSWELEPGEEYEVVLTNFAGLYRYRIGDLVAVTGYLHQAPVVRFLRRRGMLLNLLGEKTTEDAVLDALRHSEQQSGTRILDFTVYPNLEKNPGIYDFFVEYSSSPPGVNALAEFKLLLEKALASANPRYRAAREKQKIGPLQLHILKPGTFTLYRQRWLEQGASANQLKIPHVILDTARLQFFRTCLVSQPPGQPGKESYSG
jgi:hypothetical protein